jgi:hypothetical protein
MLVSKTPFGPVRHRAGWQSIQGHAGEVEAVPFDASVGPVSDNPPAEPRHIALGDGEPALSRNDLTPADASARQTSI